MEAILAFGSNLGNRRATLASGLAALDATPDVNIIAISPLWETDPVDYLDQPRFLNGACAIRTGLDPQHLLQRLLEIEASHGRLRTLRNGPRTLDLDLILAEDIAIDTPELTLPHPRWLQRPFVIEPVRALLASGILEAPCWNALLTALPPADLRGMHPAGELPRPGTTDDDGA